MKRKKGQKRQAIEEDTSNLPCEIIYTILSKLPVKSLLRFRCVCKSWHALISEPEFIKSHLNEAIKLNRQRVICSSSYKSESFYSVDYESCGKSNEELCFPIKKYRKASVLCSCNGVLLLSLLSDKMCVLWNPSTREYRKFSRPYSRHLCTLFHGIGYDSSNDNYKVVFILQNGYTYKDVYCAVYTCETSSWTETRELPELMMSCTGAGVTVSGAPHWVVYRRKGDKLECLEQMHGGRGGHDNNPLTIDSPSKASETSSSKIQNDEVVRSYMHDSYMRYAIVCFDMVEEKFKTLPPPNWTCKGKRFGLTVMRGCLSVYIETSDALHTDIWVMKEYGERYSWTKLLSIPSRRVSQHIYSLRPLSSTENDEVVVVAFVPGTSKLLLYNPIENKSRKVTPLTGMSYHCCLDSLVLPKGGKLTKWQQPKQKENGERKQ